MYYNQSQTIDSLNQQLFTEISPEQAAMVEGGLQVQLASIRCKRANGGSDDVFVSFNGIAANAENGADLTPGNPKRMVAGSFANIFTIGRGTNAVVVRLRDKSITQGSNSLGGFTVRGPSGGLKTQPFQLNGSSYEITYRAF